MNKNPKTSPKIQIKQLNFKVSSELYWKLKNFASAKRLKMSEVLKQSFRFYRQWERIIQELKELNTCRQTIPAIENQMKPFQGEISLVELESRMNNLTPIYFNKIGLTTTYEVLRESLSECLRLEKEKRGFKN